MSGFDTRRAFDRRRPWDALERRVVRMHQRPGDAAPDKLVDAIRYVIAVARMTRVTNDDGVELDLDDLTGPHARQLFPQMDREIAGARDLWDVVRVLPTWVSATRALRARILSERDISRERLEKELTTRHLVVASGGGGGAGYVYNGAFAMIDRHDLMPSLLVGTSIGALATVFRSRRKHFDLAPVVAASRDLSWSDVLRVLESESRYGLPATLRMYIRSGLGKLFLDDDGQPLRLSGLAIPTYIIATGITVDALKHDLDYYEHLLDADMQRSSTRARLRGIARAAGILREFFGRRDALVEMVLGETPGTEEFDALDAVGFSAAVPGVLHYDVLRDDERMRRLLDDLYATYGITRLGEGGLVSNVPARAGWKAAVRGKLDVRQAFVLALDCFAPNPRRPLWLPVQQLVRTGNVERDRKYADLYLPMPRTLSPFNVVPAIRDAMLANEWGQAALEPHMRFIKEMVRPIAILEEAS